MRTGTTMDTLFKQSKSEVEELIPATALVDDVTDGDSYQNALRIKSFKAYEWLLREASVYHLLICTLANQALEHVMYTFMKWQRDDYWLRPGQSPLILMANMKLSPATNACHDVHCLMTKCQCSNGGELTQVLEGRDCLQHNCLGGCHVQLRASWR